MEPFIGQIQALGFNFSPRGWAFCDGQLLPISQYTAVFSLLGTTYGGDGQSTFGLPDLRGREIIHPGQGPGLSNISWGEVGGRESVVLAISNMPTHTHAAAVALGAGLANTSTGTGNNFATNTGGSSIYNSGAQGNAMAAGNVTVAAVGGNQAFNNRNPYLGIYMSIALEGIFPSRN